MYIGMCLDIFIRLLISSDDFLPSAHASFEAIEQNYMATGF